MRRVCKGRSEPVRYLALVLVLCGCAPPIRDLQIIVRAGPVPAGAVALQVQTALSGQEAAMPLRFDLAAPPKSETSFGLTLSPDARGAFLIEVQATDGAGCAVGRGTSEVQVDRVAPAEVRVALVTTGCLAPGSLRIESAAPSRSPSSGGTEVVLRGAGFFPGAKVRFAGKEAQKVTVRSSGEIAAVLPAGAPGKAAIEIENLDGSKGSRADLFAYSVTTLRFQAMTIPVDALPMHIAAGDVDGDGAADVALSNGLAAQVITGDGRGKVRTLARATYPTNIDGYGASFLWFADLDGDGKGDLFALQRTAPGVNAILWYLFQGGALVRQPYLQMSTQGQYFTTALAGDVDGDGSMDLVGLHDQGADTRLHVFPARMGPPTVLTVAGCSVGGAAMGDLDRDGRPDLAILCVAQEVGGRRSVRVAWNDGGSFTLSAQLAPATFSGVNLSLGAFSAAGALDVAVVGAEAGPVPRAFFSLGPLPGTRSLRQQPLLGMPGSGGGTTAAADLDLDGLDDLIVSLGVGAGMPPSAHLAVLRGQAGTGPRATLRGVLLFSPGVTARQVVAADLDRDGLTDLIVVPTAGAAQITVLYNVSS